MKILVEVKESKAVFAMEIFKSISFIKKIKVVGLNEITNPAILQSIELYENRKVNPKAKFLKSS